MKKKIFLFTLLLFLAFVLTPRLASAQVEILDFEDLTDPPGNLGHSMAGHNPYHGLDFNTYFHHHNLSIIGTAHSGVNYIFNDGAVVNDIEINFNGLATFYGIWVSKHVIGPYGGELTIFGLREGAVVAQTPVFPLNSTIPTYLTANFNNVDKIRFHVNGTYVYILDDLEFEITGQADNIPPTTTATSLPPANIYGWNNTDVQVILSAQDNPDGSGVKEIHYQLGAEPEQTVGGDTALVFISQEGSNFLTFWAVDNTNNAETPNLSLTNIDKTPPVISGFTSIPPNSNGWYKSSVSVIFSCLDFLSGVVDCGPDQDIESEGINQSVSGFATDLAGNSAETQVDGINIDLTPPQITILGVADGAEYDACSIPSASFETTDALSGIDTSSDETTEENGVFTYSVTSTDLAGNSVTESVSYTTITPFEGLLEPVSQGKPFKQGRTIPLKFKLPDCSGGYISDATATLSLQMYSNEIPEGDPIEPEASGNANEDNIFRYSADGEQYIYNLSTKNLEVGTWQVQITLSSSASGIHTEFISLK